VLSATSRNNIGEANFTPARGGGLVVFQLYGKKRPPFGERLTYLNERRQDGIPHPVKTVYPLPLNSMAPIETETIREHRRQTRLTIWLPFAGGLLLLLILMIIAASQGGARIAIIGDFFLTLFVLCPVVVCMFPIYLLMVLMVFGMNTAHDKTAALLTRIEGVTIKLRDRTYSITDRAARASINVNSRFAFIDKLSKFESPSRKETHE